MHADYSPKNWAVPVIWCVKWTSSVRRLHSPKHWAVPVVWCIGQISSRQRLHSLKHWVVPMVWCVSMMMMMTIYRAWIWWWWQFIEREYIHAATACSLCLSDHNHQVEYFCELVLYADYIHVQALSCSGCLAHQMNQFWMQTTLIQALSSLMHQTNYRSTCWLHSPKHWAVPVVWWSCWTAGAPDCEAVHVHIAGSAPRCPETRSLLVSTPFNR